MKANALIISFKLIRRYTLILSRFYYFSWPHKDYKITFMSTNKIKTDYLCDIKHSLLYFVPRRDGLVVSVSASHNEGRGFVPRPGHTKGHHKNGTNCLPALHACVKVGV